MMFESSNIALAGFLFTILGAVWTLAWWLSYKFTDVRNLVYTKMESLEKSIVNKLEYHERHDDTRFTTISNDLWAIRVRNAAIDGGRAAVFQEDKEMRAQAQG